MCSRGDLGHREPSRSCRITRALHASTEETGCACESTSTLLLANLAPPDTTGETVGQLATKLATTQFIEQQDGAHDTTKASHPSDWPSVCLADSVMMASTRSVANGPDSVGFRSLSLSLSKNRIGSAKNEKPVYHGKRCRGTCAGSPPNRYMPQCTRNSRAGCPALHVASRESL